MTEETKTKITTVTIPIYLVKLLDDEAKREDRSRSYQLSKILSNHFEEVTENEATDKRNT